MEPRIETLAEKKLIGIRLFMTFADNQTPVLWKRFMPRRKEIQNNIGTALISLQLYAPSYFNNFDPNSVFEKWAAVEVANFDAVPYNMETMTLGGGLYAVFSYKGAASTGTKTFQYIFGTWIPSSIYTVDNRPHFEILGEKYKHEDPNSEEEIWIPIRPMITKMITEITVLLNDTFGQIDLWFEKDAALRNYRPKNGGWSIAQILEHIGLTNHFLLILIDKGTNKALLNPHKLDLEDTLKNYTFHRDKLREIGLHKSFDWIRPEHMEPNGEKTLDDVKQQLKSQLGQCLEALDKLQNGEGVLYKTTMSVNDLGKIDVYEYIYFLAQHGQRHLTQMAKNEREFYD
jgi:predicted transcriptional regulator YdeE